VAVGRPTLHGGPVRLRPVRATTFCMCIDVGEFSFMGSLIIEEVIKDLVELHGLSTASTLFLAGSRFVFTIHNNK